MNVESLGPACHVEAWRAPGIEEISEVFHAQIVDYGYPLHSHDTWTVLIVDTGAIAYDLDKRHRDAIGDTVAVLPPGVTHNGKPAPGARGFVKRVLYLDESVLPTKLIGAAVDQTSITDRPLRRGLSDLHDELKLGADPFAASSAIALIADRIAGHLKTRSPAPSPELSPARGPEHGTAHQLRLLLDEPSDVVPSLDAAARMLGRSKAHLIRSFTAEYGVAPHAYSIGKRVDAARKLLLEGCRVADVAAAVGFYDQSHLTRHFKRHTSVPPGVFAASHQ